MRQIPPSELILNQRGAIYHLDLRPDEIAQTVITVGDPARVERVSRHFDEVMVKRQHREFITHTGRIGQKQLSVISSGIGPDNIDIVLNELDALVNINLDTRTVLPQARSLQILRLGTCGSLQADIPADSFVASTHGIGMDNLLHFYQVSPNEEEGQILQAFYTQTQLQHHLSHPYLFAGYSGLLKLFTSGFHHGITITSPGFYGPQGRVLRLGLALPQLNERLASFRFGPHRITNFEMETAAIYGLGRGLGHQCMSVNAVVANRVLHDFSAQPGRTVDTLIEKVLGILAGS